MVPEDSHRIPRDPCYSGYRYHRICLPVQGFHLLRRIIPDASGSMIQQISRSYNPVNATRTSAVQALPRSLATTRGIINLFSLPTGTKMFQFPAFAAHTYVRADSHSDCRVVPFGDPRIKGYLHLIADYRSLSRPSSPVRAKASTVRPKNSLFAFIMIHHTFI